MIIGGWQKLSLIDFPKKLAAVLFTQGCSFRCSFCHNKNLVIPEYFQKPIPLQEIFNFLEKRKHQLQGVVVSGGEPLIHKDIIGFIQSIKDMGYAVKLDTSGIFPEKLEELLEKKLLDYVAMDIKAPLEKYAQITIVNVDTQKIQKSITLIMDKCPDYEFRTTIVPSLHTKEDILAITSMIKGAKKYILQNFSSNSVLDDSLLSVKSFSPAAMRNMKKMIEKQGLPCLVR